MTSKKRRPTRADLDLEVMPVATNRSTVDDWLDELQTRPWRRFMVALDDSAAALAAVSRTVELARGSDATVNVVSIAEPSGNREGVTSSELVQTAVNRLDHAGIPATGQVVLMPPDSRGRLIAEAARSFAADVVVLGAHPRTGFAEALKPGVLQAFLTRTGCDLVLVRSPA